VLILSEIDWQLKSFVLASDTESVEDYLKNLFGAYSNLTNDQIQLINSLLHSYTSYSYFYDILLRVKPNFQKNMDITRNPDHELSSTYFRRNPNSKILIFAPKFRSNSAGIKIFHQIIKLIEDLNYIVDVYTYEKDQNLQNYFMSFCSEYNLVIIPETISHLPFKPKKLIIYHGEIFGNLPATSLGNFEIDYDSALKITHSKSIDANFERLFISTLDFKKFFPSPVRKLGGTAIYLGKREMKSNVVDEINYYCTKFNTSLIITRNFPHTNILPLFARELDLLVSLDHFSSTNLEFTVSGCKVFFPPEITSVYHHERLKNFELFNSNFIFRYEDLINVHEANSESIHENLSQIARVTQQQDVNNFSSLLKNLEIS
jgi:hypothetical protein